MKLRQFLFFLLALVIGTCWLAWSSDGQTPSASDPPRIQHYPGSASALTYYLDVTYPDGGFHVVASERDFLGSNGTMIMRAGSTETLYYTGSYHEPRCSELSTGLLTIDFATP